MSTSQLALFPGNRPPEAHARSTDPVTSWLAARTVKALPERQEAIFNLFKVYGPMTHEELQAIYKDHDNLPAQSVSGIRTWCSELVAKGKLKDSGDRKQTAAGRNSIVWRVA